MNSSFMAVVAAGAPAAGAAQADEIILGHGAHPGSPRRVATEKWAGLFAACTGGAHGVTVALSATMGDEVEMLTSITAGMIEVTASGQGAMAQIVPEIALLGLPLLFADLPAAWAVLDGDADPMLDARAATPVVAGLGWWSGLDAGTQDCALSATAEAGAMQRQLSLEADAALRPKTEAEGVTSVEADHGAFVAATAPCYDADARDYPELAPRCAPPRGGDGTGGSRRPAQRREGGAVPPFPRLTDGALGLLDWSGRAIAVSWLCVMFAALLTKSCCATPSAPAPHGPTRSLQCCCRGWPRRA